jgi:hypothetical protein
MVPFDVQNSELQRKHATQKEKQQKRTHTHIHTHIRTHNHNHNQPQPNGTVLSWLLAETLKLPVQGKLGTWRV